MLWNSTEPNEKKVEHKTRPGTFFYSFRYTEVKMTNLKEYEQKPLYEVISTFSAVQPSPTDIHGSHMKRISFHCRQSELTDVL